MFKAKPIIICCSLFFMLIFLLTSACMATATTVSVTARKTVSTNVDLNIEDEVSGRIIVIGDEADGVNFTVFSPNGQSVFSSQMITVADFKFSASETGTYHFIFDNSLSPIDKTVSFNYNVKHYWFGMPQEICLMIIVVLVGALALAIYATASKG